MTMQQASAVVAQTAFYHASLQWSGLSLGDVFKAVSTDCPVALGVGGRKGFLGFRGEDLLRSGRRVIAGVHVLSCGDDEEAHADEEAGDKEQGEDGFHGGLLAQQYTTE